MSRPEFTKDFRTYGQWLKAMPRDTRYAKEIIRKHKMFPDKSLKQLRDLKISDYDLSKAGWETLTSQQRMERHRSLQILRAMRKGASLNQMTEKFGMKNKDAVKLLGRNLYKENGRWKATKNDSLEVEMRFYDRDAGHITIVTRNSKDRYLIAEYKDAVDRTLKGGDTSRLKKFEGVKIVDNAGKEHSFETRLDRLYDIEEAQVEGEFQELYVN
ncbi:hypothetical protein HWN40_04600 [Methanolobus zinderi]|uniref:Uncharacterized protein n=1 Tax=Methanolobus zinderi TaxID=536044 RepID=A0A7D5I4F5_9EURY|nr:hypothetical protein [Methanolobus zinderi]KXS40221.1 MAG: hypothetical protein AWU59_2625 [Methanolobus sp. T82-4]QLC49583.1 hypothetical protein HWN40_04600 [Methanolobus zinderi]